MTSQPELVPPHAVQPVAGVVHVESGGDGVAVLRLGAPEEKLLTLTDRRMASLDDALRTLQRDPALRAVVVTGPGPGMFAAGADITAFETIGDAARGAALAERGRALFGRFEELSVPVVGAIEGPCLGGGCEMALCFDLRLCSDAPGTLIGLPETKLGIVPGFGGTQRLTRLVGLPKALDVILAGKALPPKAALRAGLIDRIVPAARLLESARRAALDLAAAGSKAPPRRLRGADRWLSAPLLRGIVARKVRRQLASGQARFYAAPKRALELCLDALRLPAAAGFDREARALGELIVSPTCRALVHLFFLTERAKKLGKGEARAVARATVVGGGVMGAGIAGLLARHGVRTRLCDLEPAALARAKARLQESLDKSVRRRRLERHEAQATQDRLAVSTEQGSLRGVDLFLEAIVEDLDTKRALFAQAVERGLPEQAIIATNTSSLSIDAMAEGLPAPERVVGLHFFNPPEQMPLVEIVRGPRTSPEALAVACKLAVRLGKFPVIVGDAPGFLVNRCLAPYLNEAAELLLEGAEPEFVDRVMLDFGMPMGPARLLDEVGFDVACKVADVMAAGFPERLKPGPLFAAMVGARALGRKAGGGLYDADGERPGPGRAVLARLRREAGAAGGPAASREDVVRRLVYPLVDEAYRCLDDGIVGSEADLDLGLVMGIGFPPFSGGVTRWAQREGPKKIVEQLDELARTLGPRFAPGDGLRKRALANP
jgi:3-hydroxyacyl-CoA dehydrogenase/enoyl-CoA hydratase/3-hydroxybutyryl-CoA epimerase